ncbi:hypothetical protein CMI46_01830 [Candidatus Pacearchaeota archaeon]|nr:hypothetical protein [Candidatus Pacearchaeota archaeon]|tara:strand:- start:5397 stop:5615 length:219 start_codon:yes stop_codon:yes gene_type:complete
MNCKWTEIVLSVVILIFAWYATAYSQWVVTIAAALLLVHALMCKSCNTCAPTGAVKPMAKKPMKMPIKKKKK